MTLDYKHRGEPKEVKKSVPAWVWIVVGLSIGLFAAFLAFLVANKPETTSSTTPTTVAPVIAPTPIEEKKPDAKPVEPPATTPAPTATEAPAQPAVEQQPAAPKFSFYTTLPNVEVEIPEEELQKLTGDKKPPAQTAPTTQDSVDSAPTVANTPATAAPTTEKPQTKPASTSTPTTPKPTVAQPEPTPPAATNKAGNKYVLQVGAYSSQGEAERVKAKLAFAGISASIQAISAGGGEKRYRVRVGPYATLEQADSAKQQLRQQNMQAIMLKIAE